MGECLYILSEKMESPIMARLVLGIDIDGKRVESLELETGNFLPGREIFIDG